MNTSDCDNEWTMESSFKNGHKKVLVHLLPTKKPKKATNSWPGFGLLAERLLHRSDWWLSGRLSRRSQWQVDAAGLQLSDEKRTNALAVLLSPGA